MAPFDVAEGATTEAPSAHIFLVELVKLHSIVKPRDDVVPLPVVHFTVATLLGITSSLAIVVNELVKVPSLLEVLRQQPGLLGDRAADVHDARGARARA